MSVYFDHIVGNDLIKQYLCRMVEKKSIANVLLFAGPDGVGKALFAHSFAKCILCANDLEGKHRRKIESGNHPDIREYRPEGKVGKHSIDSMRQFSEEVYRTPYEAEWKVFIIYEADRMLAYSANALLKTLEEPLPQSIIILLSSSPEALLSTIRSRCRTFHFHALPTEKITQFICEKWGKSEGEAKVIASLANGSIGIAFELIENEIDVLRRLVLQSFAKGKFSSYSELMGVVRLINQHVEKIKKQTELSMRSELLESSATKLTSVQQLSLEKEVDGAVMLQISRTAQILFEIILSWYRDLHLVHVKGNFSYLMHPDFFEAMQNAVEKGTSPSIEKVQEAIKQANQSIERSIPLSHCLETLFLQINFL